MKAFITSLAFASLATCLFALRFRFEKNYKQLIYFIVPLMAAEWIAEEYFIPKDAFGYEVAIVLFAITGLIILVIRYVRKLEAKHIAKMQKLESES